MKIRVWAETGFAGQNREDELEVDDDATDEEIEHEAREWFFNFHSYGWEKAEPAPAPADGER